MQSLAVLTRTNRIKSIHKGFICVTDSQKNVIYNAGVPSTKVYLCSSAKPIQAVAFVHSGAMKTFNISLEELAIICSSHIGGKFEFKGEESWNH